MIKLQSIFISSIALILTSSSLAFCQENIEHYPTAKPSNAAKALEKLDTDINEIAKIISKKELGIAELERIHQISYSLEAASEKIAETKSNTTIFKLLEAVEELHEESEEHNEKETIKWFQVVKEIFAKLQRENIKSIS